MTLLKSDSHPNHVVQWQQYALYAFFVAFLALALFRAPESLSTATGNPSYRAFLYDNVRLGHAWGHDIVTNDGPLGALQDAHYTGGSIWMAMTWQIGGNFLLSLLFVSTAWSFPWKQRLWLLSILLVIAARIPIIGPWLGLVLLGYLLVTGKTKGILALIAMSVGAGILGLSSIAHFTLTSIAILLFLISGHSLKMKWVAVISWMLGGIMGWLVLGQNLGSLWAWLATGYPLTWTTSALFRVHDISMLSCLVALSFFALIGLLFLPTQKSEPKLLRSIFLLSAAILAWKGIALQPFGEPTLFFATLLLAAFALLKQGIALPGMILLCVLSLGGLLRWNNLILFDGLGHLNRQTLSVNIPIFRDLPSLRATLKNGFNLYRPLYGQPKTAEIIAKDSVDVMGEGPVYAYYNDFNLKNRPAPIPFMARTPLAVELNQQNLIQSQSPAFVLQRPQRLKDILPGILDGPAQLTLYQNYRYKIQFAENGFLLWKKQTSSQEQIVRVLVASGTLTSGIPLTLPEGNHADAAYWLEIDLTPNWLGRAWTLFDEVTEPAVLIRDHELNAYYYSLPHSLASRGFLISPLIRGEADLVRPAGQPGGLQANSITLLKPHSGSLFWGSSFIYRLYKLPAISLSVPVSVYDQFKNRYRTFNRLPIATTDFFIPQNIPGDGGVDALTTHPDNDIEFAISSHDNRIRGKFGIVAGAYKNKNATDGVDFSIEFIASDGSRQVLFHRWLNPAEVQADRGLQSFEVSLPSIHGGRLLLRTYNPVGRSQAYDWSYWANVIID